MRVAHESPQAAILIRDTDGDVGRADGHREARDQNDWGFEVVLGLPHPRREAWVLAGFEPESNAEHAQLASERKYIGFDPRERAEDLRSGKTHTENNKKVKKSTKRVLDVLTRGDRLREERCWSNTPLETLRTRGGKTGLSDYLAEVKERLVPLVGC